MDASAMHDIADNHSTALHAISREYELWPPQAHGL